MVDIKYKQFIKVPIGTTLLILVGHYCQKIIHEFYYGEGAPTFRDCVKMQLDFNDLPCHLWRGLRLYPTPEKALARKIN